MKRFKDFFRKNWIVVDNKGEEQERWYRYKNAKIFADEMNSSNWDWLKDFRPYEIRPVKG